MWVKASASLFIRSPGALLTWPAAGERRQTRRLYILSVSMCSVVYTTSAAWVRHCAGLFATRVDEGKTAPARRFPAARLDDLIAGFGRPLTAGQLTAWFRAWPSAAFEGRWDRLAGAWRPRRGHWGVLRTQSWPAARSPLFQQPPVSQDREPGPLTGPSGSARDGVRRESACVVASCPFHVGTTDPPLSPLFCLSSPPTSRSRCRASSTCCTALATTFAFARAAKSRLIRSRCRPRRRHGLPLAPQLVFTDINLAVPDDRVAAAFHLHRFEEDRVFQGREQGLLP